MGENLSITGRRPAQSAGAINSAGHGSAAFGHTDAGDAGTGNGVIHNFSSGVQRTLCPAKLFGIIVLFERRSRRSTAACPLYD